MPSTHVYVSIEVLPADCAHLCRVVRHAGLTSLTVDPRATRMQVHDYCAQFLTDAENNRLRQECGQPPVGQAMDDDMMDGMAMTAEQIPPALRWPDLVVAQRVG